MNTSSDSLSDFSLLTADWFRSRFESPTPAQRLVWPEAQAGNHLLLTSPTGTGKTLAAFLTALDSLISGRWPSGQIAVLYISPLKALNQDIRLNLEEPLAQIRALGAARAEAVPGIRIETRSGDTSSYRRRRIIEAPPEILITTPESLNIMLATSRGRGLFSSLRMVILDEIHNIAGNKRGTHLVTALERLTPISGEFQRLALSATLSNPDLIARFIGGYDDSHSPRPVTVLKADAVKEIDLTVDMIPQSPPDTSRQEEADTPWKRLAALLKSEILKNRSTLVFVNSRRLAEKISFLLNSDDEEPFAYAHHGSLSKEIRSMVEERLKSGRLRCIVATNSLELGIDIGFLDQIILVQTPFSIASAVQKIGRAGHQVGAVSCARLYCSHGRDLLDALTLAEAIGRGVLEDIKPPTGGLDLLAQIILGEILAGLNEPDAIFNLIRRSTPYHDLKRSEFDSVLEMLAGEYRGTPMPLLIPRIRLDTGKIIPLPSVPSLLFSSGGTIPDRGYFALQTPSGAAIGELDEEFVWERKIGDIFSFGSRLWRISALTPRAVEVQPASAPATTAPFYRADPLLRDYRAFELTGELLEELEKTPARQKRFRDNYGFTPAASLALDNYIAGIESSIAPVHRHRIVAEYTRSPRGGDDLNLLFIHTLWGGRCNAPLGLALETLLKLEGKDIGVSWDNDSLLLFSLDPIPRDILGRIELRQLPRLIEEGLRESGIFGARFREAAGRALLLPRAGFNRRTPLWLNRLRAKRLLAALTNRPGFPLIREALGESLEQQFDLPRLFSLLEELEEGRISLLELETEYPSPLCDGPLWDQINYQIYSDDRPDLPASGGEEWAVRISSGEILRPRLDSRLMDDFISRLGRTAPGYRPETALELNELLRERVALPAAELLILMEELPPEERSGVKTVHLADNPELVVHAATLTRFSRYFSAAAPEAIGPDNSVENDFRELFSAWFYFQGPSDETELLRRSPFPEKLCRTQLIEMEAADELVRDYITDSAPAEKLMHRLAYEKALGYIRGRHRAGTHASIPLARLPELLAHWQGLGSGEQLPEVLAQLEGFFLPAQLWEKAVLPLRLREYRELQLDEVLQAREIVWRGGSGKLIAFFSGHESPLVPQREEADEPPLLPAAGAFNLREIIEISGMLTTELIPRLWHEVWRGRLSADSWQPVRDGIRQRFRSPRPTLPGSRGGRRLRGRPAGVPLKGNWFSLPERDPGDALDRLEEARDAVRILFSRYPVLFREQLHREQEPFRWRDIFPALRLMEFSGEVVSGMFLQDLHGLQFILAADADRLRRCIQRPQEPFLLHISDPASPAGIPLPLFKHSFPARRGEAWLVIDGGAPLLHYAPSSGSLAIADKKGFSVALRLLTILIETEPPILDKLSISSINGVACDASPFEKELRKRGFSAGLKEFTLWSRDPKNHTMRGYGETSPS